MLPRKNIIKCLCYLFMCSTSFAEKPQTDRVNNSTVYLQKSEIKEAIRQLTDDIENMSKDKLIDLQQFAQKTVHLLEEKINELQLIEDIKNKVHSGDKEYSWMTPADKKAFTAFTDSKDNASKSGQPQLQKNLTVWINKRNIFSQDQKDLVAFIDAYKKKSGLYVWMSEKDQKDFDRALLSNHIDVTGTQDPTTEYQHPEELLQKLNNWILVRKQFRNDHNQVESIYKSIVQKTDAEYHWMSDQDIQDFSAFFKKKRKDSYFSVNKNGEWVNPSNVKKHMYAWLSKKKTAAHEATPHEAATHTNANTAVPHTIPQKTEAAHALSNSAQATPAKSYAAVVASKPGSSASNVKMGETISPQLNKGYTQNQENLNQNTAKPNKNKKRSNQNQENPNQNPVKSHKNKKGSNQNQENLNQNQKQQKISTENLSQNQENPNQIAADVEQNDDTKSAKPPKQRTDANVDYFY